MDQRELNVKPAWCLRGPRGWLLLLVWPRSGPGPCEPGLNLNRTHRFRFGTAT